MVQVTRTRSWGPRHARCVTHHAMTGGWPATSAEPDARGLPGPARRVVAGRLDNASLRRTDEGASGRVEVGHATPVLRLDAVDVKDGSAADNSLPSPERRARNRVGTPSSQRCVVAHAFEFILATRSRAGPPRHQIARRTH